MHPNSNMNYKINKSILIIALLILVSHDSISQDLNTKSKFFKTLNMGIGYQVQEYQLLNQTIDSDCNCLESLPLSKRSLQTYNLSTYGMLSKRWALGLDLGYGSGYTLNDKKQYKSGAFFQTKFDTFYQLFNTGDKLRPYLTSSLQLAVSSDDMLFSLPIGAGLRLRLKKDSYLHAQAAYDAGITQTIAKNLITNIGIHFPIMKSKVVRSDKSYDTKVLVKVKNSQPDSNLLIKKESESIVLKDSVINQEMVKKIVKANGGQKVIENKPIENATANTVTKFIQKVNLLPKPDQLSRIVYFDIDKSLLNKLETSIILADIYFYMVKYPESEASLYGHTDGTANLAYNEELSHKRVQSVLNYFVKLGISKDRFVLYHFGDLKPATSNTSLSGRSSNRRVEIILK